MSGDGLRVLHVPLGYDHPYQHFDHERVPRYPAAGESVTLRAGVTGGDPEAVLLKWWLNGEAQPACPAARQQPLWSQPGCWAVSLGPFSAHDRVEYRWLARADGRETASGQFAFAVLAWEQPRAVSAVESRGAELAVRLGGAAAAELRLTALVNGVLQVGLSFAGAPSGAPAWSGVQHRPVPAAAAWRQDGRAWAITTPAYQVRLETVPLHLQVLDPAGRVLVEGYRLDSLRWLADGAGRIHSIEWAFATPQDEQFYGGGERYDCLGRRGTTIVNTVFNQYRDQGTRTYIPVPFLLSSRGYGLYVDTARVGALDVADTAGNRLLLRFDGGDRPDAGLDWYLLAAPTPRGVVQQFTAMVGRPELPPRWAFGPWMSANSWDRQWVVEQEAARTLELDIPATVLVIEAWSDEITFCMFNDATYEPVPGGHAIPYAAFRFPPSGRWPDPAGMVKALHEKGLRVVLWQIPVWKHDPSLPSRQKDLDEEFLIASGYVVRNADGTPYRISDNWFAGSLLIDFTNPAAVAWWLERRRYLLTHVGIDGFKTDGGEFVFGRELVFSDGRRGDEERNLYANQYIGAAHGLVRELRGDDGLTFSRAGYTGAQRFPMHWAGDERSTFAAFRSTLVAGLNAGLCGIPFWGWDLAGFSGDVPSAELFCRSAAMACFCPVMQYHSEVKAEPSQERTPWNVADRTGRPEALSVYRFYAHLRMSLLPYLYGQARRSAVSGLPMMQPMWLMHPDDPATASMWDQYYLGDDLLVAPVVEEGAATRRVYLPAGEWYDFWDHTRRSGPCWVEVAAPWERIPVFVRAGAALPLQVAEGGRLGTGMNSSAADGAGRLVRVYPPAPGPFVLRWDEGGEEVALAGRWEGNDLVLELPALPLPADYEVAGPDGRLLKALSRAGEPGLVRLRARAGGEPV